MGQSGGGKPLLLPPDVTPDHVLGLVELLHSLGGRVDSMHIGDAISEDVRFLPHAIDVAEALGLIVQREGNLELTDLGRRVAEANPKTVRELLRRVSSKLEPIRSIVERLEEKGEMLAEEFMEHLQRCYSSDFERAMQNVLSWGAFLGLFKMDEDDERVLPIRPAERKRARGGPRA